MTIVTEPPDASCALTRKGGVLGVIAHTPGELRFPRESGEIAIDCTKLGYQPAHETETPLTGMTVVPALGGLVALAAAVDAASGANYRYRREIAIKMNRVGVSPDDVRSEPLTLNNLRLR